MSSERTQDEGILNALLAPPGSEEQASLQSKINVDAAFGARVEELRAMLADLGALGTETALFSVTKDQSRRLKELWPKATLPLAERVLGAVRELVASLTFDSLRDSPAVAVRGSSDSRMMRLRCDEACIDLRIEQGKPGEALNVAGQVESLRSIDTVVVRGIHDMSTTTTKIQGDGYFEISLPPGRYGFRFQGADVDVVIDAIEVKALAGE